MKQIVGALIVACTGATSASAATLTLTLGGTFYEGAPQYEIVADGVVVASGTVASERDDVVRIEVGEPKALAVRFINDFSARADASGKRPPGMDRNLIIQETDFKGQTTMGWELFRPRGVSRRGDFAIVAINQAVEIPIPVANPVTVALATALPTQQTLVSDIQPATLVQALAPAETVPAPAAVMSASFQTLGAPQRGVTILMLPATEPVSFTSVAPPTALAASP